MTPVELRVVVGIVVAAVVAVVIALTFAPPAGPLDAPRPPETFWAPSDVTIAAGPGCPAAVKANTVGTNEKAVAR